FSSRRRHTRSDRDWSSDVCSSDLARNPAEPKLGIGGFAHRDDFLKALDMAAKMSGWGTPLPEGWARGIAIDDRRRPTRTTSTIRSEERRVGKGGGAQGGGGESSGE